MANLINIMYEHEGRKYDLQAEDMGVDAGSMDLRIYHDGVIVFQRSVSYRGQVSDGASSEEHDRSVRALMIRHIETLKKGIVSGKVG